MIILGTNSIKDTGYDVANSCRFDDGSNCQMRRAGVAGGNQDKFTLSMWIKRANISTDHPRLFTSVASNDDRFEIYFENTDELHIEGVDNGTATLNLVTSRKFRDVSAWYHILLAVDTGQGTEANRAKLYINGVLETAFGTSTRPDQDGNIGINTDSFPIQIGEAASYGVDFDGYFAEIVFLDGTQSANTDLGEFDEDSGIWKPIDVDGLSSSKGNNGFYLDFEASDNLGNDVFGGTDFSEANLATTDQSTDTCTNNFATLNSLINFNSGVFSEGNLAITSGDDTVSTIGLTSGRWYWEAQRTNTTNEAHIGIGVSKGFFSATSVVSSGDRIYVRGGATFVSAVSNLGILTFASNSGTPATISNGDVIGFYLDLESSTKNITVKKNDGATPIIDIDLTYSGEEPIFPFCRMNSGCASSWNFGNPIASLSSANADANGFGSFEFNPTKGGVDYFAICTKNLAEYG